MGTELGHQTAGIFTVNAPVEQPFELGIGNRNLPTAIAVPLGADVLHFAQRAAVDHLHGDLVDGAVTSLQANLEYLIGPGVDGRHYLRDFLFSLGHHLLDKHMLAGAQRIQHHRDMQVIGRHDKDRFDILAIQYAAIIVRNRVWDCLQSFQHPSSNSAGKCRRSLHTGPSSP